MLFASHAGSKDIYDGNLKLIMGFIWTLINHYQIRSTTGLSAKQAMKEWLNTLIPEHGVQNFTTDWNDGRALCGLVDHLKPGLCPNHLSMDWKQALENCHLGMELAQKHFRIPAILDPEDLRNPDVDDLSVMTYLSYFFEPALKQLLEWFQHKIPQQKITNLSTDWNSGINLAALMAACHELMPNWKELDPHNSLANMKECVEVAKRLLNIKCPVAPSVLTDPKVDEVVMATYLSRFKYSKLMAQAEKLSTNLPHDVAVVGMPIEFDSGSCSATGPGLTQAIALEPATFSIITPEKGLLNKPDTLIVKVSSEMNEEAEVEIKEEKNGAYLVTYIAPTEGNYKINIEFYGDEIPGCPFETKVLPPPDASKCRAYGSALRPNASLSQWRKIRFFVNVDNAGTGKLWVEALRPNETKSKISIKKERKGVYSLTCDDTPMAGWYTIKVEWGTVSKKHIPGSPFKLSLELKESWRSKQFLKL